MSQSKNQISLKSGIEIKKGGEQIQKLLKSHAWPILFGGLFFLISYFLISPGYTYLHGDEGFYGYQSKTFYETNKINLAGSSAITIGQLLSTNIFVHIFGFSLKNLHLFVYFINFLCFLGLYLLLIELGIDKFLSFFGSLVLFINPISLTMIDSYMTEPFFMVYLIFSLYLFIKGLKSGKCLPLYIGSICAILAVYTRQHAVSLPFALILLFVISRKQLKHLNQWHYFITTLLPLAAVGLFYLFALVMRRFDPGSTTTFAYASENLAIIKQFVNPIYLAQRLYFDSLMSLHYSALYVSPLFIIILISLLLNLKKLRSMCKISWIFNISLLLISIGTFILFFKNNLLMPYLPSIFNIGILTSLFDFSIMNSRSASLLLTIMTSGGALLILIQILHYFTRPGESQKRSLFTSKTKKQGGSVITPPEKKLGLGPELIYLWGSMYILTAILIGLRYDRYILPVSLMIIYILLSTFPWIRENKKLIIFVFIATFSIFTFKLIGHRLSLDLEWEAASSLLKNGIDPLFINGGLGFNNYYSYYAIKDLYRNVNIGRPINWRKFHPMATYFVRSSTGLERERSDLELINTYSRQRFWGLFKSTIYIYKRKDNCRDPIWLSLLFHQRSITA